MVAAAGKKRSFDSALAATLVVLELIFSFRKKQRTALKSFLQKEDVFGVLPTGNLVALVVVALSYCVQREFERQPFIPPLGLSTANGSSCLPVGNQLSCADVHLFEATLMLEENLPTILSKFPVVKAFQERMRNLPSIAKFLQPGSKRKPPPDDTYVKNVCEVLNLKL